MAVPTLSNVVPSKVWTGGQLVTLTGTGFRVAVPPTYAHAGPYPAPVPTVRVTVGGKVAKSVSVKSSTSLTCIVPAGQPGAAPVVVTNLDDSGAAIPGESVTLANAITYARPALDTAAEPDLGRVNRAVIRYLKQTVIENVTEWVHSEYGEEPYDATFLSKLPALALSSPDMRDARPYYRGRAPFETGGYPGSTFELHRAALTVDLAYEVSGFAASQAQIINLQSLTVQALTRAAFVEVARDPADAAKGTVRFPLYIEGGQDFRSTATPNKDNVRSFSGSFIVRGVPLEHIAGFPGEDVIAIGGVVTSITVGTTVGNTT